MEDTYYIPYGVTEITLDVADKFTGHSKVVVPPTVKSFFCPKAFEGLREIEFRSENGKTDLKEIGPYSFDYIRGLRGIKLPEGLLKIGKFAFIDLEEIKGIVIPSSVREIDIGAFKNCRSLERVIFKGDTRIVGNIFSEGCDSLMEIRSPFLSTVNGLCVHDGTKTVLWASSSLPARLEIPYGIKAIAQDAFIHNDAIREVVIPDSVEDIGIGAFSDCPNLEKVRLPRRLRDMGSYTFRTCRKLKDVYIPSTVMALGMSAFENCVSLEKVTLPPRLKEIPDNLFSQCKALREVNIPSSVRRIGDLAFEGCENLREVLLPKGLVKIGYYSFADCHNLTDICIPESVTTIKPNCFDRCKGPIWVKGDRFAFRDGVLYGKTKLLSITGGVEGVRIPDHIRRMRVETFLRVSLKYIFLPKGFEDFRTYDFLEHFPDVMIYPEYMTGKKSYDDLFF